MSWMPMPMDNFRVEYLQNEAIFTIHVIPGMKLEDIKIEVEIFRWGWNQKQVGELSVDIGNRKRSIALDGFHFYWHNASATVTEGGLLTITVPTQPLLIQTMPIPVSLVSSEDK